MDHVGIEIRSRKPTHPPTILDLVNPLLDLHPTLLPFVLGVEDLTLIAITFSSVWFIYAVVVLIAVFLIKPGLKINVNRKDGITVVRYELLDSDRKEKSA